MAGSPTLAAIDDMVARDASARAVTPMRVGGWRGRLLRAWQALFTDGRVTIDEYEREVAKAARATEPEALASVAKQEARRAREALDAHYKRERRERQGEEERKLRKRLRELLEIDVPDAPIVQHYGGIALELGGVRYSLRDSATWHNKPLTVIEVVKPCIYQERGCTNYVTGHNNIGFDAPGYTPLAQLGAAMETFERTPHCSSAACTWRAEGKTEEEVAALAAEMNKSQPWNAPVDYTNLLTRGSYWGGSMGYSGQYGVWYGRRR